MLMVTLTLFVSMITPGLKVSAATIDPIDLTPDTHESVNFDLNKNQKQEFTFIDENGEKVTYGAEPVITEEQITPFANHTIGMGKSTWKIYWYNGAVNMSYYIDINRTSSSTRITNAYDLSVNLIGYTESNRSFGFTSSKAEYSGTAVLFNFLGSLSIRLTATVSGNTLTTKAKA